MSRKPKPKNQLSAGQRAALYEKEQQEKLNQMRQETEQVVDDVNITSGKDSGELTDTKYSKSVKTTVGRPKREKQKPAFATVKVDFSISAGKVKPVHGMCNGPISYEANISQLYKEIGIPYVRFDKTDSCISKQVVDISRIFPDMNADENNPESYHFEDTDRYIAAAYNSGARVIYRLGESVACDNFALPSDIDKWVSICTHIIRHYNDYWADGFAYGIEYFEILNCSDLKENIYRGNLGELFGFYGRVSKELKLFNGDIFVGGMGFAGYGDIAREFIKYCSKNKLPLDFISFNAFVGNPEEITPSLDKCMLQLYNSGYSSCKIFISEWGYVHPIEKNTDPWIYIHNRDGRYSSECREIFEKQKGIVGAAFDAAFMLQLNSSDSVYTSCHYDGQPSVSRWCDICDRYGNPSKAFYSFKAYGEMYRAKNAVMCLSEQQKSMLHSGVYALAALSDRGEGYVMLAAFDGCTMIDLRLNMIPENAYTADIYMIDGVKNLELCDSVPLSGNQKRLLFNISSYGVTLIKIY